MNNTRPYQRANFSRHPRDVLPEIQASGELDEATRVASVYGRTIPINPRTGGNAFFEGIARRQGFDGLPQVAGESEVDRLIAERLHRSGFSGNPATEAEFMEQGVAGVFPLFRYFYEPVGEKPSPALENARNFTRQFRSGPLFAGVRNRYGAGIYFIPYLGVLSGPAIVLKAALRLESRIVGFPDLAREMRADELNPDIPRGFDPGYYAACRGYNAFFVQDDYGGDFYTVVLNRTALVVCETDSVENGS